MYTVKIFKVVKSQDSMGAVNSEKIEFPTLKDALHFVRFVLEYYQITLPDGEIISRCDLED